MTSSSFTAEDRENFQQESLGRREKRSVSNKNLLSYLMYIESRRTSRDTLPPLQIPTTASVNTHHNPERIYSEASLLPIVSMFTNATLKKSVGWNFRSLRRKKGGENSLH